MSDQVSLRWEQAGYSDVAAAARQGSDVGVEFANGDVVRIPAATFGVTDPDFDVEPGPDEGLNVRVTMSDGRTIDLSWTQIRSAHDPFFAQELRRRDAEQSKKVGLRLKALREDRNLNQRSLAEAVSMSAPQLSKIESGTSDLRVSTVQSLVRAMGAQMSDLAGPDALEVSRKNLRKRAEQAGVSADVMDRLVSFPPRGFLVRTLSQAFGWPQEAIVEGILETPQLNVAMRLKAHHPDPLQSPLIHLAYEAARAVRSGSSAPLYNGSSSDPAEIRSQAKDATGRVTLESLLDWMWGRGIPVVPLLGKSGFSAAVWSIDSVPIVVLKEARPLAVYWLFDLAHELGHIVLRHISDSSLVDIDAPRPDSSTDTDENAASAFALDLLLPGHRQMLADVRTQSRGSHLRFKFAVEDVAAKAGVSGGLLGMIAAYELVDIGEDKDRWGSASNLAKVDGHGRPVAEAVAGRYLPVETMSEIDATLIRAAILTGQAAIRE